MALVLPTPENLPDGYSVLHGTPWHAFRVEPALPLGLLAEGYELRSDPALHGRYRRERFSGGVNLTAQAFNAAIDSKVYVWEAKRVIYVSPRMLKHWSRWLRVT